MKNFAEILAVLHKVLDGWLQFSEFIYQKEKLLKGIEQEKNTSFLQGKTDSDRKFEIKKKTCL